MRTLARIDQSTTTINTAIVSFIDLFSQNFNLEFVVSKQFESFSLGDEQSFERLLFTDNLTNSFLDLWVISFGYGSVLLLILLMIIVVINDEFKYMMICSEY